MSLFPHIMKRPSYLIIANPEGKRCQAFLPEIREFWQPHGVMPEVQVVPWRDLIQRNGNLEDLTVDRPTLMRIESPGKDYEVARMLLQAANEDEHDWFAEPYKKGKQIRPGLLYRGFCQVLKGLQESSAARPWLTPTANPLAIAELFDKNATAERLAAADIPVPDSLVATVTSDELLEASRSRNFRRAYVKLNTGSSASCMAVVHPFDNPCWGWSSLMRFEDGFYSTRQLCRYEGEDLHAVLRFLMAEGACVQRGISMAQIDGQNFDLRIIMIDGQPAFHIFRLSDQPMTNLHFGGRRGNAAHCRQAIPTRAWLDALDHCIEAASLFDSQMVGIDLLFERGYGRHYILEINAFGDFFPGLRDELGRTVHAVELATTARKMGWLP